MANVARGDYIIRVNDARIAPPADIYTQLQKNSHCNTTLVILQPGSLKPVAVTALKAFYEHLLVTNDGHGNVHTKEYAQKLRAELRYFILFIYENTC